VTWDKVTERQRDWETKGPGDKVTKRQRDKTDVFSMRKKGGKKLFFFFGHEVLFYERTFSASALEHRVQITLRQIGVMPKQTDREANYMCFSPLRRKTSKLEGEEVIVGSFPVIYVIGNKIKSTKVA
jgi:hypothetical protein